MKPRSTWVILALLLAGAGTALLLYATRDGPGVRGDSVRYVMGAQNLLAGNGFSRLSGGGEVFPETGFAPLLSFVLAGIDLAGIDMYAGARLLNALLFGGSIFLVVGLVRTASRSTWVGLLGGALVLTGPNVLAWHASLMSEGLFLFLCLLSLYALVVHIRTGRPGPLYMSAVAAGMASLARYAGVSLIPVGVLGILLWGSGSRRERSLRAATYGFVAAMPFVLWMVRNQIMGGAGLANRQIRFHTLPAVRTKVYLFQPTTWVLPEAIVLPRTLRGALALLALAAGPALFLVQARRRHWSGAESADGPASVLPWLLLILVPCYVGVLVLNSLFLDAGTTFDGILRYLTPLFVFVVMLELVAYAVAFPKGRARWAVGVLVAAWVVGGLVTNTWETLSAARQATFAGEFTRIKAEEGELARIFAAAPIVITDNPELVYYLSGRPAYTMPIKFDLYQQTFREDFPEQVELARSRLEAGAILVVVGEPSKEQAEVIDLLVVSPLQSFADAVVYGYPQ